MGVNLRDLHYVALLAQHQHFGKAAEAANVSQPTLSSQIKKLEDELGVTLFERDSRNVALTPAGEAVLAEAQRVLGAVEAIKDIGSTYKDPLGGTFRLGVIASLGPFLIPDLLEQLRFDAPRLDVHIREGLTEALLTDLAARRLDAVLVATEVDDSQFVSRALFTEPFLVAHAPQHRLAARPHLTMDDVQREKLLLLEEGHCLRDQVESLCLAPSVDDSVKAASLATLMQMVARNQGMTLLPALAREQAHGVVLRELGDTNACRVVRLVTRQQMTRPAVLELLPLVVKTVVGERLKTVRAAA